MWFKNLRVYKLTDPISLEPGFDLADCLAEEHFMECGSLDNMRFGFVPPMPGGIAFTHEALGFTMICARKQEKILPSGAINELLDQKVKAISEAESRSVGRKERQSLKDEVIFSLLPKALTKSTLHYAYIDHKEGLIFVNGASAKSAEDLLSKLREALESLRCIPFMPAIQPSKHMVKFIVAGDGEQFGHSSFDLGETVELKAGKDERVIRAKKQDLGADEILAHINSGMYVSKLALDWKEAIQFTIDESFAIKGLKFADKISEKANDRNPESKAEQFDADFAVMTTELRAFFKDLVDAFGGEASAE